MNQEDRSILITRIRRIISTRRLSAILITSPENRLYLSGFNAEDMGIKESAGALLITPKEQILLTDSRYIVQAKEEAPDWKLIIYQRGLPEGIKKALTSSQTDIVLGYEPEFLTCKMKSRICKAIPNVQLYELTGQLEKMRAQKHDWEMTKIKRSVRAAEEVFNKVWEEIKPGMTEKQIAFNILEGLYTLSDGPSFPPIVASGPNAAKPHATPTDRKVAAGEPIIIDMGAKLDGYCSDMTRTIFIDGIVPTEWQTPYKIVKQAQDMAQEALKPGISVRQIDKTARDIIKKHGFGQYFIHALGHGVGLAVHESPVLSPRCRKNLSFGMVVTIEPGIYIPGLGGIRLENMAMITDNGAEILSSDRWFYE